MAEATDLEYKPLELARMAFELGLMDQPRNFGDTGLICRLCGYRGKWPTFADDKMLDYSAIPAHWIRDHHPMDLIMRAADKKGTTDG